MLCYTIDISDSLKTDCFKMKSGIAVTLVSFTRGTSDRGYSISILRIVLLFTHDEQLKCLCKLLYKE